VANQENQGIASPSRPLRCATDESQRSGGPSVSGGTGATTVLVVATDGASREGLRAMLQADGHAAETAPDVWRALTRLRERAFDVVIVDLDLPPLLGIRFGAHDLIRMLLATGPSHSLVLLSAEDSGRLGSEIATPRIAAFLEKPISPLELRTVVSATGARRVQSPHGF